MAADTPRTTTGTDKAATATAAGKATTDDTATAETDRIAGKTSDIDHAPKDGHICRPAPYPVFFRLQDAPMPATTFAKEAHQRFLYQNALANT